MNASVLKPSDPYLGALEVSKDADGPAQAGSTLSDGIDPSLMIRQAAMGKIDSLIKTYYGRDGDTLSAFITVAGSGGVRDLTFWHPEQSPGNIVPYPFVIEPNGGPLTIENITLINAYQGVNMSKASMCFIDNIQGTPLNLATSPRLWPV